MHSGANVAVIVDVHVVSRRHLQIEGKLEEVTSAIIGGAEVDVVFVLCQRNFAFQMREK